MVKTCSKCRREITSNERITRKRKDYYSCQKCGWVELGKSDAVNVVSIGQKDTIAKKHGKQK